MSTGPAEGHVYCIGRIDPATYERFALEIEQWALNETYVIAAIMSDTPIQSGNTSRWRFATPIIVAEARQFDEKLRRRASWFQPIWFIVKWPLLVPALLEFWIVGPFLVPSLTANMGLIFASRPPGIGYWVYFSVVMVVISLLSLSVLGSAIQKLVSREICIDDLLGGVFALLGVLTAIFLLAPGIAGEG